MSAKAFPVGTTCQGSGICPMNSSDCLHIPIHSLRYRIAKRLLDLLLVAALAPIAIPVLLILAVLIKLTSPGPVFYRHLRVGQYGRPFRLWKLRTMWAESESLLTHYLKTNPEARTQWQRQQKLYDDPRVTPLGRLLRKSSLDELPQLINILLGEMSFVGPRPITDAELRRYGGAVEACFAAKPGLTGLWQVRGRGRVQYEVRVSYDTEYVCTWTLSMDVVLLLKTIPVVWSEKGAY